MGTFRGIGAQLSTSPPPPKENDSLLWEGYRYVILWYLHNHILQDEIQWIVKYNTWEQNTRYNCQYFPNNTHYY